MWNRVRIDHEHEIKERYGLRNLRELWTASTEVSRIRRNAREVLSNKAGEKVGKDIIGRLSKYNIVGKDAKVDDLLGVTPEAILSRRLQSIVLKVGLSKTIKQSRQLITHGFISINGRKVKSPGYLVTSEEEHGVGYYKPINLNAKPQAAPSAAEAPVVKKE
jgi:small subunit ribosomal protein S4